MCKYIALNKCRCIDIFINICTHNLSVAMLEDQDLHKAIQSTRGPLLVQNMKVSLKSTSVVGQIVELLNISDRCIIFDLKRAKEAGAGYTYKGIPPVRTPIVAL